MYRGRIIALLALGCLTLAVQAAPKPNKDKIKRKAFPGGVVLETEGTAKRVIIPAKVCLVEGPLEGLLTRTKKKEHEYILATDADARMIMTLLIVAGGKPGKPAQFNPKYKPASGSAIGIKLRYQVGKKTITVRAQDWIRAAKSKEAMKADWVFAGSIQGENPDETQKTPYLMANHGDVICVCNMETALLDLAIESPKKFDIRHYEVNKEKIPAKGTKVELILEVLPEKKKGK